MTQLSDYKQQDIDHDSNYVIIQSHTSHEQIIQHINHFLTEYIKNGFSLEIWELDRNNCTWDHYGRVRINKKRTVKLDSLSNTSRGHLVLWVILCHTYTQIKKNKNGQIRIYSNRALCNKLKSDEKILISEETIDKFISSFVIHFLKCNS